ncbi:MAG: ligand-gated channel protein [Gammaproteobacteria bacterium]|nr:MAG: ligand-gated channel protein [Gammaproteobacteria bacterium]
MPLKLTLSLTLFFIYAVLVQAEELEDDLLSLSLEQLMQIQVISSNGIEETLIDAPAAMLVITKQEITQRGYNNLSEILVDLPGFDVINSGASYTNTAYQRGYRTPFTTRTLFMIDGRIENHLWSQQVIMSRQYPISMISRIEVLYGPASVKYGANAFLGVINVITKKGVNLNNGKSELSIKAELGSWNSKGLELFARGRFDDFSYELAARLFSSDEENLSNRWGFLSNELYSNKDIWGPILDLSNDGINFGEYADQSDDWGFFASLQYKNFKMGASNWLIDEGYGTNFTADRGQSNADWLRSSQQYFIEHQWQVNNKFMVNSSVNYRENRVSGNWAEATPDWRENMSNFSFVSFTYWNSTNNAVEAKQDLDFKYSNAIRYLAGWRFKQTDLTKAYDIPGYWNAYSSTVPSDAPGPYGFGAGIFHSSDNNYDFFSKPLTNVPDDNRVQFNDIGAYGAIIYDGYPWRLNLGLRYDDNQIWGAFVNPRVAAIYKFNQEDSAIKLVYGEAFQEPPAKQLYGGWSGRRANPNLLPEKVQNLELILMHKTQYWLHDVSLFRASYDDVIREDAINDAKRQVWGLEYRGRFEYNNIIFKQKDITGQFFYSYTNSKSNQTYSQQQNQWLTKTTTLGDISPHKINLVVNLPLSESFNANIKGNFLYKTPLYSRNPLNAQAIKIGSRVIFDAVINYQYSAWIITAKALNLFDRKVFAPGIGKADSGNDFSKRSLGFNNSLTPQPGRSLWLTAQYQF